MPKPARPLSYTEVQALPALRKVAYLKKVEEAKALLGTYEPLTAAMDVLEAGRCWGIQLKLRTYVGSFVTCTSDPKVKPSAAELRRRAEETSR